MVLNKTTHLLSIQVNGQYTKQTQGSFWIWECDNQEVNDLFHSTFASFSPKFMCYANNQIKMVSLSWIGARQKMGILISGMPQATTNAELCVNIKVQLN